MFWNPHVDTKGRTKKMATRVTAKCRFSLVSNEEPHLWGLPERRAIGRRQITGILDKTRGNCIIKLHSLWR